MTWEVREYIGKGRVIVRAIYRSERRAVAAVAAILASEPAAMLVVREVGA